MEKVAKDPPATGLLITMVIEGMPAREAGLRQGDILVAYGGVKTPDRAALQEAVQANEQVDTVDLEIVRAGKPRTVRAEAGRLGIQGVPVQQGLAVEVRPPATKVSWNFAALEQGPLDFWMSFALAKRKAGFEHHLYRRRGSTLLLDYEVAFDGGKTWGLNHFIVNLVLAIERGRLEAQSVRFENPVAGWITEGTLHKEGSKRSWRSSIRSPSGRERNEARVPAEMIPSYAVSSLPIFLEPVPGTCLHYTPLNEGLGVTATPAGLVCAGEDEVTVARRKVRAWRWESHSFGEQEGGTWVSADDRLPLKVSYGGPTATRGSREDALRDLPEGIEPHTA